MSVKYTVDKIAAFVDGCTNEAVPPDVRELVAKHLLRSQRVPRASSTSWTDTCGRTRSITHATTSWRSWGPPPPPPPPPPKKRSKDPSKDWEFDRWHQISISVHSSTAEDSQCCATPFRERGSWSPTPPQDNHGGPITYPLGPDALGLIMYTGDGYMSAQLMRRGRPAFDRPESDGGTLEQFAAAAAGYLAYSGPFEVDESTGVVHHNVTVSLLPNWLNGTQLRHAKLDGDHLTLSASQHAPDGIETISTVVWKCAPGNPTE